MAIEHIIRTNVSNEVFEKMKSEIIVGTWAPGSRIPSENDLADSFGVSRMTVRSAIYKLNILGLVYTKQGDGTYVKDFSAGMHLSVLLPALALGKHDLLEMQEFRRIMEVKNVYLAALRRDENDLRKLREILSRMDDAKNDLKRFTVEDLNFHLEIARTTKNSFILQVSQITKDIFRMYMDEIVSFEGTKEPYEYHKKIYDAIQARDAELASEIMSENMEVTIRNIIDKYNEK
jgi:GntR family transcriptional repressor for pyruvate dehydrogenase complex